MPDYCEVYWFEGGAFKERRSHSSSKARVIFVQSVEKFRKDGADKVVVILRHENHQHIQSWTNMTEADIGNRVADFKKRGWK